MDKTTKTKRQIQCEEYANVIHKNTKGRIECKMIKNPMGIRVYVIDNQTRKRHDAGNLADYGEVHTFLRGVSFTLFEMFNI